MAIEIRTFASGDTDYIAKLNENYATIKAAIDQLQLLAGAAGAGSAASAGYLMDALFNHADALIGPDAYRPSYSAPNLVVGEGAMYLAEPQTVVQWLTPVSLNFAGSTAGTYYVVVDGVGFPHKSDTPDAGTVWSVNWTGSAFIGAPVRFAPTLFDTIEATASRRSTALAVVGEKVYDSLDARLEDGEERIVAAQQSADDALDAASAVRYRKVGCSITRTGVVGAIQVDFSGTIIGWSVIADQVGSLTVEVSKKGSSPPPAAPAIPNPTTDKISGSAPIALAGAQSAAAASVPGWTATVNLWDVVQFNVTAFTTVTRATLYLRIQEGEDAVSGLI